VATTHAFDVTTGVEQGKVRKTIPISRLDAGEVSLVDDDLPSRTVTMTAMKGKFLFSDLQQDTVAMTTNLALPAGFDIRQQHELTVAIGNVVDSVTVTSKGAAASPGRNFSVAKLKMKYPKLAKGRYKTTGGELATMSLTLSTKNMSAKGFDTEGIVAQLASAEEGTKTVDRSIQVAVMLDGVTYELLAPVQFKLSNNTGQITGKGAK
jgi:hypothetical protein